MTLRWGAFMRLIMVAPVLFLTACQQEAPQIAQCEQDLQSNLVSPRSYRRVRADFAPLATNKYDVVRLTTRYGYALTDEDIEKYRHFPKGQYWSIDISFDAVNEFGVPIAMRGICLVAERRAINQSHKAPGTIVYSGIFPG